MIKIDKAQASVLRELMKEPGWEIALKLLGATLDTHTTDGLGGNTEFETLRALHKSQGAVEGLKQFFDDLERGAFE